MLDFNLTTPKFARSFGFAEKFLIPMVRSFLKKYSRIILLVALLFGRLATASAQEVLDGIAAVVNGDVITFSQVRDVVGDRERALHDMYKGDELVQKITEVRLAAIKELIDRQLIIQDFKKNKYNIPEYVINEHIQTIIHEQFGGDRQAFTRTLEAQGLTMAKFRELETNKIIVQAMRQKNVKTDPIIPPQAVDEYYASHREEFSTQDQVKLRMIVIKQGDPGDDSKKKMADEIRQKIKDGGEFEKLAQMYSEDSTQDSGGDWGWIDRKTLNENLTTAAFKLKAGEISPVISLSGNYYILMAEARKNGSLSPLSQVRSAIENKLIQNERQQQQEKWIATLRKKAYIKMY